MCVGRDFSMSLFEMKEGVDYFKTDFFSSFKNPPESR